MQILSGWMSECHKVFMQSFTMMACETLVKMIRTDSTSAYLQKFYIGSIQLKSLPLTLPGEKQWEGETSDFHKNNRLFCM